MFILKIIMGFAVAFLFVGITRAYSVKMVTGKWPHEDNDAMNIYNELP